MVSSSKEKAIWTAEDVNIFCKLCIEEIDKGNRPAVNKRDGWAVIINKFEELTGKKYNKIQMKSKWDNLKEEWKRWRTLIYSETGLGWNDKKKIIAVTNKWRDDKIKVDDRFKPFRTKGIHPDLDMLLARMFSSTVATGGITWNPGQGLRIEEDVDATQPNITDVDVCADDILESKGGENVAEQNATQTRKRVTPTSMRQA